MPIASTATLADQIAAASRSQDPSRDLSVEERSRRLSMACAGAMTILESRRQMGIPDPLPAPWLESTWAFLRAQAARAQAGDR